MWICKAKLPTGETCNAENAPGELTCISCGAVRQTVLADGADVAHKVVDSMKHMAEAGVRKAGEYAPAARQLAAQAKDTAAHVASDTVLHARLAAHTGVRLSTLLIFTLVLLALTIALPVLLAWTMQLRVTERTDVHAATEGYAATQRLLGAEREATHSYSGTEYVAEFVPQRVTDPRKARLYTATLLAGPILMTDSSLSLTSDGPALREGWHAADVSLQLKHGALLWLFVAALIALLLIADLFIGDIYAVQKMLFALVLVWTVYCLGLGLLAEHMIGGIADSLFPTSQQLKLNIGGLLTAPVKIAAIGISYWMTSILVRSLTARRAPRSARRSTAVRGSA